LRRASGWTIDFAAGGIAQEEAKESGFWACKKLRIVVWDNPQWDIPTERKVGVKRRSMGMDITWVTDRIALGGGIWTADNMAVLSRTGITHIIDMQIEFDDTPLAKPHGISVCWNPIDDDFEPKPPEVFARGVEFALGRWKRTEQSCMCTARRECIGHR